MTYAVIIRGPLGVGKTTISKELSKILKAHYFCIDAILDEHELAREKEEGHISQKSFLTTNRILVPSVKKYLKLGIPVVIDGNLYWKTHLDDLVKKLNSAYYVFTLKAPLEVCIKRDSKRIKAYGRDETTAVYKKTTELEYGIGIDATDSATKAIRKILAHLPTQD